MPFNNDTFEALIKHSKKNQKSFGLSIDSLTSFSNNYLHSTYTHFHFLQYVMSAYTYAFNCAMDLYMKNPSIQADMDNNNNNVFKNSLGKFFSIECLQPDNVKNTGLHSLLSFNDKNDPFEMATFNMPEFYNLHYKFPRNNNQPKVSFLINFEDKKVIECFESPSNIPNHVENIESFLKSLLGCDDLFLQDLKKFLFTSHTAVVRNALLRSISEEHFEPFFNINYISPISHIIAKSFNTVLVQYIYNSTTDKLSEVERIANLFEKTATPELISGLIDNFYTLKLSNGYFKDLDSFNLPSIDNIVPIFVKLKELIKKEDFAKLRMLRNIAKDYNIEIDYVDERTSLNSITEKKLLIFGDKIDCEAVVIDLAILTSRFSTCFSQNHFNGFLNMIFKFAKTNKIISEFSLISGKNSFAQMRTVYFKKGKKHSEAAIEQLSKVFEQSVLHFDTQFKNDTESLRRRGDKQINLDFFNLLEQMQRELALVEQLVDSPNKKSHSHAKI